jgi:hypothetical protein
MTARTLMRFAAIVAIAARCFTAASPCLCGEGTGGSEVIGLSASAERLPAFASECNYQQRVAASVFNQELPAGTLVLPHPHTANIIPWPYVTSEAERLPGGFADRARIVWLTASSRPADTTFIEKLRLLGDCSGVAPATVAQEMALVDWCEKNGAPECAEFLLRRVLLRFKSFQEPGYQPVKDRWLKFADKRETPYIFPLPLNGEWTVMKDTTGHHRLKAGAAYAFDLVRMNNQRMFKSNPSKIEDYYSWGQPVLAQADGVVMGCRDDFPDNQPGQLGAFEKANFVAVDYGGGVVGMYAHLQQGSAKVKVGDQVEPGQTLGLVGCSGAANYPHLHFTMADTAYFSVRGRFRFEVLRGGRWELQDGLNLPEGAPIRRAGDFKK